MKRLTAEELASIETLQNEEKELQPARDRHWAIGQELYEGQVEAEKFLRRPYHHPSCDTCRGYSAVRMTPTGNLRCDVCVRDAK